MRITVRATRQVPSGRPVGMLTDILEHGIYTEPDAAFAAARSWIDKYADDERRITIDMEVQV